MIQTYVRIALICFILAPVSTQSQSTGACKKSDQTSSGLIVELRDWVTTSDPERIQDRDSVFKIPVVNPAEISVVTEERICRKAILGYSRLSGGRRPTSLYVIRMGKKHFAVYDPSDKAGDMMTVHIMNRKFASIGGWTGP